MVKELLAQQWGTGDVMGVTAVAAALGLGRRISLPFAGPLSDKFGRRISVLIGRFSYVIFFAGIAFSPNVTIAYVAAVLGGIANSFLDTATCPAVAEIIYKYTGTFQLWLNCAQTFGTEAAGIASEDVSMMQTYYSAGTLAALFVTSALIGILLALFVNLRYGTLLKNAGQ